MGAALPVLLLGLLLRAPSDGAADGGAAAADGAAAATQQQLRAELAAARAANAALEAELAAARAQLAEAEAAADAPRAQALARGARGGGTGAGGRRLAACPLPAAANESLPRGTFGKSCSGCYRFGDSLRCSCFTRSQIDPEAGLLLPRGNLTGQWSLQMDDWDSSTRVELTTYDISQGLARFRVLCTDGGVAYHCSVDHPGHNGTNWHQGEGVLDMASSPSIRCNPKAHPPETCPGGGACPATGMCVGRPSRHVVASFDNLFHNNGTVDVNFTRISWNDSSVWARVPATGVTTAISLSACTQPPFVHNRNGYLSCDWKRAPPPRVGDLVGNLTAGATDQQCRVVKQYTFLAEQYRRDEEPLAVLPIIPNISWYPTWNISGVWQSYTRDRALMMDEMQIVMTASHGNIHNFTILCLDGGPTRTCSPGAVVWNWHNATGFLNTTALPNQGGYRVEVVFQGMKVANSGTFNMNFTTLSWFDHSVWGRKNVRQEQDCCAHCEKHPGCKAWTLEPQRGTCSLVGSSDNAYPSAYTISGYPLKSDPSSYCKQKFLENQVAYQDPTMGAGVECAVAVPQNGDTPSSSVNFPRPWRDTEKHHRGSAWLFFPSQDHSWKGRLDGLWTTGAGDDYELRSSKDLTTWTAECVYGGLSQGGTGTCDSINPGHNGTLWHAGNGTLDLQSRNATIHFDNLAANHGQFDKGYGRITWSDGSQWHRQPKCNCHCQPRTDYNCYKMKCMGPELDDDLADELIRGKKWIVFFHGAHRDDKGRNEDNLQQSRAQ